MTNEKRKTACWLPTNESRQETTKRQSKAPGAASRGTREASIREPQLNDEEER